MQTLKQIYASLKNKSFYCYAIINRRLFNNKHPIISADLLKVVICIGLITLLVTDIALSNTANSQNTANSDAFLTVYEKIKSWTTGGVGKLITMLSLVMAAIGGVMGFPVRYIAGAIGVGLLLASASSIVDMLF